MSTLVLVMLRNIALLLVRLSGVQVTGIRLLQKALFLIAMQLLRCFTQKKSILA
jgi:hypothetical protein